MKHRSSLGRFSFIPALLVVIFGLLMMLWVFTQSQKLLIASQDSKMLKTVQSVDNNIFGHFTWYCSDLTYITSREDFLKAEALWQDDRESAALLECLQENPLTQTGFIYTILAVETGQPVLATKGDTDYRFVTQLGEVQGVEIHFCEDSAEKLYVAFLKRRQETDYAALMEAETFYSIAKTQSASEADDRILLLDSAGRYFFHCTEKGAQIDRTDDLVPEEHPELQHLQQVQGLGEPSASFYKAGDLPSRKGYPVRMASLPDSANTNGCFTVGLAHNYDETASLFRSMAFQISLYSIIIAAGLSLLVASLLRFRHANRQAQEELILLRNKTEAMEQLNLKTQELAHHQRLETIGTLTSSIAHEFNNLLTPIMGYSILVLERIPSQEVESYDYMLEIYNASRKAKEIISRLSALSRKNTALTFQNISPDTLVKQTLSVTAPLRPKEVEISVDLGCRDVQLYGNETQLSQMLLNLIINAFQAMEKTGGTLSISTVAREGFIFFRVADTGPGISPEVREKIFEPFFTTKETGRGSGLGLAIVRQVVDDHSGTLAVESTPSQGTCFTVCFPQSPKPEETASQEKEERSK